MSLEELYTIDLITAPAPGRLGLHIVDLGNIANPQIRAQAFQAKLASYLRYLTSAQFTDEHPGYTLADVTIYVDLYVPITFQMRQIAQSAMVGRVPIVFVDYSGRRQLSFAGERAVGG
jgi:hypothetical protein